MNLKRLNDTLDTINRALMLGALVVGVAANLFAAYVALNLLID